ncbi:MAG: hypothetical protein K0R15_1399 [Clostridiales bacterium]|jgi:V/A-type H+-transporting ATPase subunit I|nr:hypothetical protein [Clostridiales bacterium]
MAVLQMQRICICAQKKDRKHILEFLQRRGVIEINDVIPEDSIFQKTDVAVAESLLEKNVASTKEAIEILEGYLQNKKSMLSVLNGRNEVPIEIYDSFSAKHEITLNTAKRIIILKKQIAENKAEILKLQTQEEMLTPWKQLDIPLDFTGTKYTTSFIGILPNTWDLDKIYRVLANQIPLNVDIISASREQTCIFVICTKEKSEEVSEILRGVGFSHPNSGVDEAPSIKLISIKKQISECESSIIEAEKEIKSYEDKLDDLYFLQDYDTMRTEKYEVISHLLQTSKVFVMTGYIPEVETKNIIELLNERFEIAIELEQPDMDEEVPIMFKNNGFSNPLENTVEAFSPPGKGELDPTMVMSLFYYLLFGLMLSDAGYGALIAIGCGVLLVKFKNTLEISMRKTLKMYLFCGISTVFWGIMFGSYFGDIVDIVSESFFGQKITIPPLWFFPVNEPMRMLSFSLLLGLLHLLTGLGMKLYQCMKHKDYKSALYDVVLWFVLLISTVLLLLSMQMVVDILSIDFILPSAVGSISGIFAGLAAIGIVLTNGRESRNPFKRFLKGLYALYGITGYLSDVLSYSRLLALGLATGVIASVINKMAAMVTGGIIGAFFFILIVIGGHTLNIGINALGAYVHTNRLQYVEFFGKFYEGGGRMFNPFSARTKYYKFKEKIKNG